MEYRHTIRLKVYNSDGTTPILSEIAKTEPWANTLTWPSMQGFTLDNEGDLILLDRCGHYAYPPPERFRFSVTVTLICK